MAKHLHRVPTSRSDSHRSGCARFGRARIRCGDPIPSRRCFSQRPPRTGVDYRYTARLWHKLMRGLGYARYGAGGGDVGAGVSTCGPRPVLRTPSLMSQAPRAQHPAAADPSKGMRQATARPVARRCVRRQMDHRGSDCTPSLARVEGIAAVDAARQRRDPAQARHASLLCRCAAHKMLWLVRHSQSVLAPAAELPGSAAGEQWCEPGVSSGHGSCRSDKPGCVGFVVLLIGGTPGRC